MHIAYCTNVRLPSERAHGHQIAQVTNALADLGHTIRIFAPYRKNKITQSFHDYYGAADETKLLHLGNFDFIVSSLFPGVLGLWAQNWMLRRQYKKILTSQKFDLIYTRAPALLEPLLKSGLPVILELHSIPRRNIPAFIDHCKRCSVVVCLTSLMKEDLLKIGVDPANVIVEGDAVDPGIFADAVPYQLARKEWGIESKIPVIGYAGQLSSMGKSKGLPELVDSLRLLHRRNVDFLALIAGGPESVAEEFEATFSHELSKKIRFTGHLDRYKIPNFLSACDVLVYPAPYSTDAYYQRDTSPLKLFEYMAAGKPILCADLPPLHDVVDEKTVLFCKAGDPYAMVYGLDILIFDKEAARDFGKAALARVQNYTWDARMRRILHAATLKP